MFGPVTWEGTSVRRRVGAAVVAAVIVFGAAGCGASDQGVGEAGAASPVAPASPRPEGTGPLAKEIVRVDLDGSAAAAGLPANAPAYAEGIPAGGGQASCAVAFNGLGHKSAPLDAHKLDAVVRELGAREWKQSQGRTERRGKDGAVGEARVLLSQRGWHMVAEYRLFGEGGVITLTALDDACMKQNGTGASPSS